MKKLFSTLTLLVLGITAMVAQVTFSVSYKRVSPTELDIVFTGKIPAGWHVYSTHVDEGGPTPTTFQVDKLQGAKLKGALVEGPGKKVKHDEMFDMNVGSFAGSCQFTQRVELTDKNYNIEAYLDYQACGNGACTMGKEEVRKKGTDGPSAEVAKKDEKTATETVPAVEATAEDGTQVAADTMTVSSEMAATPTDSTFLKSLWTPVVKELKDMGGDEASVAQMAWWYIFILGFLGGLVALCTPCVWPIIPMTVSFFLKRSKDRSKGIRDAIIYGISIIVIYVLLGFLITLISGGNGLNSLSTNAVFNIIIFLVLVVFAVSFFGWFELELPSKWTNSVDNKASATTGLVSIFLMAFTLVLVSFSCTAPIIGLLLAEFSTSGNIAAPAVGMLGFSIALALPFTLFAMFPAWLKSAPKSGSWMNTLKVSLGFVELAFSLKFLSVADLAYGWHILDRETFLALWIAIFFLLGLYLIGKLKFQSDVMLGEPKPMPVPCVMLGLVSLAFAVYMIPGLWGAPCKAVSAFAPPMNTQDFNLNTNEVKPKYTSYEEGVAAAAAQGKPILIDFTGFGCVNCRKMEAAVWTDPTVADMLNNQYVLISLYVDDKTPLAEPVEVSLNGQQRTLRTVGDKWSYLQASKFGANAQPYYIAIDNDGRPLNHAYGFKEDVAAYIDYLQQGLNTYRR